jgi:hypothetical protein
LLGLIRSIDRRWWAPKLARRLTPRLIRDYGASQFYTAGQIRAACLKCRLPRRHLALAYAAFLPRAEFDKTSDLAPRADYDALRALVFRFTGGGEDFSVAPAPVNFYVAQSVGGPSGMGGGNLADSSSGGTE